MRPLQRVSRYRLSSDSRLVTCRVAQLAVLCIVLIGCAAPASTTEWVSATAQRDGVLVTLSASTDHIAAGELIQLRVDVFNAGLDTVSWQSGGCQLLNGFSVDGPAVAQPPEGLVWPEAAGLAKWSATTDGVRLAGISSATLPEGQPMGCPANLDYDDIAAAQTVSTNAVWWGRSTDGVPAAPGAYQIRYAFPFVGRMPSDRLGPEDPVVRPIDVVIPIVLDGQAFEGLPSTLAIDAAFADPRVASWVDQHLTRERLFGAEIRMVDGRWRFTISVAGDRSTVVLIDPATGAVVDVRLAD